MKQIIILPLFTTLLLLFSSQFVLSQTSDEQTKNIQRVRTYWEEVWGKGNLQAVADFYDPNAKHGENFTIEGFQKGVTFTKEAFPDFKATVIDIFVTGDKVISEVIYTGIHTGKKMFKQEALGKTVKVPGLDVFTFKNGKCVNHQHDADHLDLVMQMGIKLTPTKDSKLIEQEIRVAGVQYNELMKGMKSGKAYEDLEKSGDISALDKILATEYIYTSRDGVASDKKASLEEYKVAKVNIQSAEILNQEVRVMSAAAAVETGTIRYKGLNDGKPFDNTKRYTTTWIWREGRWQIIADHTSKVE